VVLACGVVAAVLCGSAGARAVLDPPTIPTQTVVVERGQSLWSIAEATTQGDVREQVRTIRNLNSIDGSTLFPGQALLVPVSQ